MDNLTNYLQQPIKITVKDSVVSALVWITISLPEADGTGLYICL